MPITAFRCIVAWKGVYRYVCAHCQGRLSLHCFYNLVTFYSRWDRIVIKYQRKTINLSKNILIVYTCVYADIPVLLLCIFYNSYPVHLLIIYITQSRCIESYRNWYEPNPTMMIIWFSYWAGYSHYTSHQGNSISSDDPRSDMNMQMFEDYLSGSIIHYCFINSSNQLRMLSVRIFLGTTASVGLHASMLVSWG